MMAVLCMCDLFYILGTRRVRRCGGRRVYFSAGEAGTITKTGEFCAQHKEEVMGNARKYTCGHPIPAPRSRYIFRRCRHQEGGVLPSARQIQAVLCAACRGRNGAPLRPKVQTPGLHHYRVVRGKEARRIPSFAPRTRRTVW